MLVSSAPRYLKAKAKYERNVRSVDAGSDSEAIVYV
jgi:hypothetical protein